MSFYTAKQIKDKYGISSQTLYNWRKNNKIEYSVLPSGSFVYRDPLAVDEDAADFRMNVIYARVSNTKQKDDLDHQISVISEYMVKNGYKIDKIYSDIASGMNENRREFGRLMNAIVAKEISHIFVSYKDRLTRFGFGYIERICSQFGVEIVVLNSTKEEDFQTELTQDLISIIHHFSMKLYSNRRKQLKEFKKILSD